MQHRGRLRWPPAALTWARRERGWYEATDPEGNRWRIVQAATRRWDVYRNGETFATWPASLAEAKAEAEEDADPAARERRDAIRARWAARRKES